MGHSEQQTHPGAFPGYENGENQNIIDACAVSMPDSVLDACISPLSNRVFYSVPRAALTCPSFTPLEDREKA